MEVIAYIAVSACAAFRELGFWIDYDESARRIYYGEQEGNKIFRGDGGFVNKKIVLLVTYPISYAGAFGAYLLGETFKSATQDYPVGLLAAAAWLAAFGIGHLAMGLHNRREATDDRERQIAWRASMKARPQDVASIAFALRTLGSGKTERWSVHTPWIRVPKTDDILLDQKNLAGKIIEWLAIPDTELKRIWVDLKFHPK